MDDNNFFKRLNCTLNFHYIADSPCKTFINIMTLFYHIWNQVWPNTKDIVGVSEDNLSISFISQMCDDDRLLLQQKEEDDLHLCLWQRVIVAGTMRQAGKFRSAPRNWLGKDLACHCPDDLYTSLVHPHPPAWSAHLLCGWKDTNNMEKHK